MEEQTILTQLSNVVKSRKKGVEGKKKGKRGESWFADKLSDVSGLHFHRIFSSGAAVGGTNNNLLNQLTQSQAEAQLGDIQSPEDFLHYFIWECKNYADLDFHNLFNLSFSKTVLGWINELEYDLQSAVTLMKNNYRPVVGFLCIKITRKGAWIIGNEKYINDIFFKNSEMKVDNILYFVREPNEVLKKIGFGNKYFMMDFTNFVTYNKEQLFIIDSEKQKRIQKAISILKQINHNI